MAGPAAAGSYEKAAPRERRAALKHSRWLTSSSVLGRLLYGVLGLANRLLCLALCFLGHALGFHLRRVDRAAGCLTSLTGGFVGGALDLVSSATHGTILSR